MLKALTGVVAAIFKRSAKLPEAAPEAPKCDALKRLGLVSQYREQCACRGDQYGSWGPCELCKRAGHPGVVRERPSRNYLVTRTAPDKFHCEVMVQDGWERWDEASLKSAVESVIRAAEILNISVRGM